MRTLVFDIHGPYAHFRKYYAPVSPVTYPFPPPPTVLGIVGAVCGYGKTEYHERVGWRTARISVRLLHPVRKYRTGLNLINTKEADRYFRPRGANPRSQIPWEFLKNAAFRIYLAEGKTETMHRLKELLKTGKTHYTTSLGLAQCLADVKFVGDFTAAPVPDGWLQVASVVPEDTVQEIRYFPGRRYERFRIPCRMDASRVVHNYREVVVDEEAGSIEAKTDQAFEVNGEVVLFF
jgi:CRISPR-associated protein Cas5h